MLDEDLEQRVLAFGELHARAVLEQCARRKIEREGAEAERLAFLAGQRAGRDRAVAPQHRVNAGEQFLWQEGFAQVVVGTEFEPEHAVHAFRARGQHDHGNRIAARAQLLERGQAVDARHHEIEHDHGRAFAFEAALEVGGVVQDRNFDSSLLEEGAQQVAQIGVVVDEEHLDRRGGYGRSTHER